MASMDDGLVIPGSTDVLNRPQFARWREHFEAALAEDVRSCRHGDLKGWLTALESLPNVPEVEFEVRNGAIVLGESDQLDADKRRALISGLRVLQPWRKGPFNLFGVELNAEWRSDLKWDRLAPYLPDLRDRTILDVGCGNGYFCWRMLDQGARYVMGIDPSVRFLVQFRAIQQYIRHPAIDLLTLRSEDMPPEMACFDTVFSMGVIYHRKQPLEHLAELRSFLQPGGSLVLETLVLNAPDDGLLVPTGRYAQMRNVWFIPGVEHMKHVLERSGFRSIECVDINQTNREEQRCTDWMQFHSLEHFLDPEDPDRTIEGYPAPTRAIFLARAPD